jgi:methanogenic corrinoid protein MtbC1
VRIAETNVSDTQTAIDFFLNVLQPAQREIGLLWQLNSVSVAVEHYATGIAQGIVARLSHQFRPRRSRGMRFVGVCPEGEHHCMGLQFVCDLARLDGWESYFLGANLPLNAIRLFVEKIGPDAIGVSVATLLSLQNARSVITTLNEAAPKAVVLAGGYGVSIAPELWKTIGADAYARDAVAAVATLDAIANDREAYLGGRGESSAM